MDGKSMIPPQGNTILYYSSQQPSLPWTLEGLFELTWCPSRALASCVASGTTKIQGHRQVCRDRRGGPSQQQLTQTLVVSLLKTHFFYTDP